ncbi:MAG: hypothetical protein IPO92_04475 [Saprospiraceae bacterium]|nr:hypothetical protein [Saprospiraceae bacterium]
MASFSDIQYLDLNDYSFHKLELSKDIEDKIYHSDIKSLLKINVLTLLIGIRNDIYAYDVYNKKVESIVDKLCFKPNTNLAYVRCFEKDASSFFILTPNSIYTYSMDFKQLSHIFSEGDEIFQQVYYDKNKGMNWVAASNCLSWYSETSGVRGRKYFKYKTDKNIELNNFIIVISPAPENQIFMSGMGGLMIYDIKSETAKFIPYSKGENENQMGAICHFTDKDYNFWRSSYHDYCNVLFFQNDHLKKTIIRNDKTGINVEPYKNVYVDSNTLIISGSGMSGFAQWNKSQSYNLL